MFKTPILLVTFNRPDHTRRVLTEILKQEPQSLYVCQDGAREGNENDRIKCQDVRNVVNELTDAYAVGQKDFMLHTLYQEKNLGCGSGPQAGITWFFENVEQGIIMEDDCLAHPDFFPYCEELLNRYKGTEVKFINSTLYDDRWTKALVPNIDLTSYLLPLTCSYGFSRYMVTGAWASYREVWQGFDLDLKDMSALKFAWHVYRLTGNLAEAEWWWYQVRAIQQDKNKKSYWDYQMQIHLFRQNALTIHPAVNLISNIGFDAEGTHTKGNDGRGDREVYPILPLSHPETVTADSKRDMRCWAKKQSKGLLKDILYIIYHLFAWRKKFVR